MKMPLPARPQRQTPRERSCRQDRKSWLASAHNCPSALFLMMTSIGVNTLACHACRGIFLWVCAQASPWLPAKFLSDVCSTIYLGSRPKLLPCRIRKTCNTTCLGVPGVHGVLISLVCLLCVFTWNSSFAQVFQHYTNVCASVPKLKSLSFCRAHEA
jgi:hypothetical protein